MVTTGNGPWTTASNGGVGSCSGRARTRFSARNFATAAFPGKKRRLIRLLFHPKGPSLGHTQRVQPLVVWTSVPRGRFRSCVTRWGGLAHARFLALVRLASRGACSHRDRRGGPRNTAGRRRARGRS